MEEMKPPEIDLTKARLLFEKQPSGLYLPVWQLGSAGSAHFREIVSGTVQRKEVSNPLSGTRTTVWFAGAISVYLGFFDYGASQAKELRVVFNAVDDADADAKVLNAATRTVVPIGKEYTTPFPLENKCNRMDIYSDVTSDSGVSKAIYEGVSV